MLENLNTVMESVKEGGLIMRGVGDWLHIPWFKQDELEQQYPVVAQRRRAYSAYFLTHHPAPCWWIIAIALYENWELGALEVVQKLYLRGEPCADNCRSEGRIDSLCIMSLQCTSYQQSTACCYIIFRLFRHRLNMSVHVRGLVMCTTV